MTAQIKNYIKVTKYEIRDWADNICFKGKEFYSFEDAWDFIYAQHEDNDHADEDGTSDEYFVERKWL